LLRRLHRAASDIATTTLNNRLMALQREMREADDRLKRLYRLIEDGVTDTDDVLKDRLNELKVIGRGRKSFSVYLALACAIWPTNLAQSISIAP
jgi:hypothetical protein